MPCILMCDGDSRATAGVSELLWSAVATCTKAQILLFGVQGTYEAAEAAGHAAASSKSGDSQPSEQQQQPAGGEGR